MEKTVDWFTKKDNIKIILVIVLAIVLLVVLKNRMSGEKDAEKTAASPAIYKTAADTPVPFQKRTSVKTSLKRNRGEQNMKADTVKSPPFLERDLFSYRNTGTRPKRNAEPLEGVDLVLTATIIDEQGAIAIIGNEVLRTGEMVQGMRVTAIENKEVVLSKGRNQYVLRIKED